MPDLRRQDMLTYSLENINEPMYLYLYKCIKNDILTGKLKPKEKADSIFVSDLDDIICNSWIFWIKDMNFCYNIILSSFGIFRRVFENLINRK